MGSRVLQAWECDRCGALDEGTEDYVPRGWRRLRINKPGDTHVEQATICEACHVRFGTWWRDVPQDHCRPDSGRAELRRDDATDG